MTGLAGAIPAPHILLSTPKTKGAGLAPEGIALPGSNVKGRIEDENPFDDKGKTKPGYTCSTVSTSKCVESCVDRKIDEARKNPPRFKVAPRFMGGYLCSDFADEVLGKCQAECKGKQ